MDRISFDRSLYLPAAVEAAVAAFAGYATITLEHAGDTVIAAVSDVTGGDREEIENAFCTFALQETIVRMRRGAAAGEEQ